MNIEKFNGFKFTGPPLDDFDFPRLGARIGVGEDIMHAFIDTETAGKSTDSKGRMKALYEPHKAYQYSSGATRDKLVKANLAYLKWGTRPYPKDSYPRIEKAYAIAGRVALLASSWGFPQILGKNYELAGYDSVEEMVLDFQRNEDNQLEAMINFLNNSGLGDELRVLEAKLRRGERITPDDCRAVVRSYNGPGYEKNNYHVTFARNLNRWAKIPDTPWEPGMGPDADEDVRLPDRFKDDGPIYVDFQNGQFHPELQRVQQQLRDLGYPEVGQIDGKWGSKTRAAVLAFRADNGLELVAEVDPTFLAVLTLAKPREISEERATATAKDLREKGSETIEAADYTQIGGTVLTGGGVLVTADKVLTTVDEKSGVIDKILGWLDPVSSFVQSNATLLMVAAGAGVIYYGYRIKKARVADHRSGRNVGR